MIKSNFDFMVSCLEHGDYFITALFQPFRHKSLPTGRDILWNKGEGETRRKQSFYRDAMVNCSALQSSKLMRRITMTTVGLTIIQKTTLPDIKLSTIYSGILMYGLKYIVDSHDADEIGETAASCIIIR